MTARTRLARATGIAQWIVGVAAATAVVLLFTLDGAPESSPRPEDTGAAPLTGAEIYAQRCAVCHGASGQGGLGPRLAGTVTVIYPNAADEAAVIADGRRGMPAFAPNLDADEIAAVVAFTRDELG